MRNKITFFVLSNSGSPIKQATTSKSFLFFSVFFLVALIVGCIGASLFGIKSFNKLKQTISLNKDLKKALNQKQIKISEQHRQIEKFAKEINALKSNLLTLRNFEKRIRMFANIENGEDEEGSGLFGIGGSIPEDLDSKTMLKENQHVLLREMHKQVEQLSSASLIQKKGFESLLEDIEEQKNLLASTPSIKPVKGGYRTSRFGYRKSPFTGQREFHKGLDIAARYGTPIMATADGVVIFSGRKGFFGNAVVIDHGHGMITRYAHMKKALIKPGKAVKRGDVIGLVGNTGRSTGPHVHYEVRLNGVPVNPEYYILN